MNAPPAPIVIIVTDSRLYRELQKQFPQPTRRHHLGLVPGFQWAPMDASRSVVYGALCEPDIGLIYSVTVMLNQLLHPSRICFVGQGSSVSENLQAGDLASIRDSRIIDRPSPAVNRPSQDANLLSQTGSTLQVNDSDSLPETPEALSRLSQPRIQKVRAVDMPPGPGHLQLLQAHAFEQDFDVIVPGISGFSDALEFTGTEGNFMSFITSDLIGQTGTGKAHQVAGYLALFLMQLIGEKPR